MARKKEMCSSKSNGPGAGIVLLKLEELHSFEGHPFKVERNQELFELRCSIEKEGVLVPLLVRKNPHGDGYEIISGHRRKEAALWTGLTKVPVIIRELDDDQSVIAMIDSNLQREKILPSEKAFALLLSLAVVYGPMMIAEYLPYGMQKALDLIPMVGSSTDIFRTNTFRIWGKLIWSPYLLITIPVLIGILCMPFAIKSWSRRMKA